MKKIIKIETGKSGDGIEFSKTLEDVKSKQKSVRDLQNQSRIHHSDFITGSSCLQSQPATQMSKETNTLREELIKKLEGVKNVHLQYNKVGEVNGIDSAIRTVNHFFDALQSLPAVEQPEKNKRSIKEDFIYWLEGVLTYNIDDGLREQLEAKLDILSQQPSQPEGKTAEQVADMYWMDRQKFVKEIEKYAKEYANQPRKEWISVDDHLPEPHKRVRAIRTYGNGRMEETHTSYIERTECFDDLHTDIITHWQYIDLPTPPKK